MPAFDPYHKWLGIPPAEQPPNHYRLLGVGLFEQDADVIESAADRQMVHVRSQKHGPHADVSQRVLNELAAARLCLLDPHKKAAYDDELRTQHAPRHVARAISAVPLPPTPAAPPPPRPTPVPSDGAIAGGHVLAAPGVILEQPGVAVRQPSSVGRYAGRRKKSQLPLLLASLGGGAAVLAVIIVLANNNNRGDDNRSEQPGKSIPQKSTPATDGPSKPLPDKPALWKPEDDEPSERPTPPTPPNTSTGGTNPGGTNPGGTSSGGKQPGPVRLPDPIILGPDGKPKNGGATPDDEEGPADPPIPPAPRPPAPRLPVPSSDALKSARRELRENYAEDFKSLNSDEKKFTLAEKLFKAAPLEKKGSARRYAMWETIRELSEEAGIPKGAANAAGALAEEFEIAEPVMFVANSYYDAARNARTPEGRDATVEYAPFLLYIATRHDDFAAARRIVLAGKAAAAASPAAKRGPLNEECDVLSRGVAMFEKQYRERADAQETLNTSAAPESATDGAHGVAHRAIAMYEGLLKDNWQVAAPHLLKAEDAELKKLGAGEAAALTAIPAPKKMTELAAAWTAFAMRQNSPLKEAALLRARHWYVTALGRLRGDDKKLAKQAIENIDAQLDSLEFAAFLVKLNTARELAK